MDPPPCSPAPSPTRPPVAPTPTAPVASLPFEPVEDNVHQHHSRAKIAGSAFTAPIGISLTIALLIRLAYCGRPCPIDCSFVEAWPKPACLAAHPVLRAAIAVLVFRRRRQTLAQQWAADSTPEALRGSETRDRSTQLMRTQARKAAIDALPARIVPSPPSAPPDATATAEAVGAVSDGGGSDGGAAVVATTVAVMAPAECVECVECVECAICLCEPTAGETVTTLPCGHEFHARCIRKWLDSSIEGVCPLCKRDALPSLGLMHPPPSRQQGPLPAAVELPDAGGSSSSDSRAISRQIDYSA